MTFLEALKTGRPMRRRSVSDLWPSQWLFLGYGDGRIPCWRQVETGNMIRLTLEDYLADDWEVMP